MLPNFDLDAFISQHVTKRTNSLFAEDLKDSEKELFAKIKGKSALVIGGAGTIGSSFIKALLRYNPGKVIVIDINENGLTELVRSCRSTAGLSVPDNFKTYPISFDDPVFVKIFRKEGPFDIVANFAAHKHVRSEKDIFSIEALINNNVIKAKKLLDLLLQQPPSHFFCVSTDKAANPVNIMGASKKLMEEVILSYADSIPVATARFANVAFSNGSLPAGFLERLAQRQPLSSPNDVRRYFVSPRESGEICLMACILGESGDIFFPKLDEKDMILFSDVALSLLESLGLKARVCGAEEEAREWATAFKAGKTMEYPVLLFPSNTSGEKLYEEFYTPGEEIKLDAFRELGIIKNSVRRSRNEFDKIIGDIESLFRGDTTKETVVGFLKNIMPNFSHIETGLNLDQKM